MPILDSIRKAENNADNMRAEATEKVKDLLDETKVISEEKARVIIEETKKEEKRIDEETFKNLKIKELAIFSAYEKEDEDLAVFAKSKFNGAIDYMIKRVFDL